MDDSKEKKDRFMDYINELKEADRQRDLKDYEAGVSAEEIMRRNSAVNPESAKKARIKFG